MTLQEFLNAIDTGKKMAEMDLYDKNIDWRHDIPNKPGWYFVETNTPKAVLQNVGQPKRETNHYNIPERINYSSQLENSSLTIEQKSEGMYVVYNGEAKDLKARAREHVFGSDGTYCLGLSNYTILQQYEWCYWYVRCQDAKLPDDKIIRIFGEQIWRATHGWPILCKR